MADLRIPILLSIPGIRVRFLSCEPLLGGIDLDRIPREPSAKDRAMPGFANVGRFVTSALEGLNGLIMADDSREYWEDPDVVPRGPRLGHRGRRERAERFNEAAREIIHRVEIGAAVVEMLDTLRVNGKLLGDCTSVELLRAADADGQRAHALQMNAAWLRKLGRSVGPNETVRTANRDAIVAILREKVA